MIQLFEILEHYLSPIISDEGIFVENVLNADNLEDHFTILSSLDLAPSWVSKKFPNDGVWKHFKSDDHIYKVEGVGFRNKSNKWLVVYRQLYEGDYPEDTLWGRSLDDFLGFKTTEDGCKVKRFVCRS